MTAPKTIPPPPPKAPKKPARGVRRSRTEIDLNQVEIEGRIGFRVRMAYVRSPGVSVRDLWDKMQLSDDPEAPYIRDLISYDSLVRRATREAWTAERDDFWKDVQKRVLAHAKQQIVQDEINEIGRLMELRTQLESFAFGKWERDKATGVLVEVVKAVRPNSLEGLVNALTRLDKRISEKRGLVIGGTIVAAGGEDADQQIGAPQSPQSPPVEDNLSDAEIDEIANFLAAKRAGVETALVKKEGT